VGENTGGTPGGSLGAGRPETAVSQPKEIVARGYDAIALRYAQWAGQIDAPVLDWVRDLDERLPPGADVVELGCGRGVPVARELARRHRVTGVDISAVQIELARHHVPEGSFIHADATELQVAPRSLDAVVALYLFGHIPAREQADLIVESRSWLRDGGFLLATFGAGDAGEDVVPDWLGAPMYFASLDSDAYLPLLWQSGFEPLRDEVVVQHEPGHGEVAFRWVLAQAT
jgi:predicted TPR repeat methyltransferase